MSRRADAHRESAKIRDTATIAERYGAAWNAGDLDAIMALQGEDMVFHLHAEGFAPATGADAVRAQFGYFLEAWPDMRFTTTELSVGDAMYVDQYRFAATLAKPFPLRGELLQPTGRPLEVAGVDVITVRDGLVRTKDTYLDTLALHRALRPGTDARPGA
ncbi:MULTISPECIES: nuclear transport factor 2 family protein [Amycolatopsis]|uniref:nuclear transport factor 2 family protein n=1 Tax=Amycolatopsis TaxID=1813 RepID=UPI0033A94BA9